MAHPSRNDNRSSSSSSISSSSSSSLYSMDVRLKLSGAETPQGPTARPLPTAASRCSCLRSS
eukprot:12159342-Heterocapsa_arctica.AAC.1